MGYAQTMFEQGVSELPTPPVLPTSAPVRSLITDRSGTAHAVERPQLPTLNVPAFYTLWNKMGNVFSPPGHPHTV